MHTRVWRQRCVQHADGSAACHTPPDSAALHTHTHTCTTPAAHTFARPCHRRRRCAHRRRRRRTQFARVKIQFTPAGEDDEGATDFTFVSDIKGGSVPKEYIPGVQKGVESVLANGVLAGFPVLGLKATLIDGAYHDVDSSVMAFEIAGRAATREGLRKAGARLMEPIMKVGTLHLVVLYRCYSKRVCILVGT
jgi:translation elongation factor EF-G